MKTQVTITMDESVKRDLQAFAKEVGMTMSALLNLSAKKLAYTRHIDFDFSNRLTPEEKEARAEALADLEAGRNVYTLEEFEEKFNLK